MSGTLTSSAKEFCWTLTFLCILSPYLFIYETESKTVDLLGGACAIHYSTSAALITATGEGIMTQTCVQHNVC